MLTHVTVYLTVLYIFFSYICIACVYVLVSLQGHCHWGQQGSVLMRMGRPSRLH